MSESQQPTQTKSQSNYWRWIDMCDLKNPHTTQTAHHNIKFITLLNPLSSFYKQDITFFGCWWHMIKLEKCNSRQVSAYKSTLKTLYVQETHRLFLPHWQILDPWITSWLGCQYIFCGCFTCLTRWTLLMRSRSSGNCSVCTSSKYNSNTELMWMKMKTAQVRCFLQILW